jgi:hypothetical protein
MLNNGSDKGWGSQLNSCIIIVMGYKQSLNIVAIWILMPL